MARFAKPRAALNGVEDFDQLIRQLANEMLPAGTTVIEADGDALVIGAITTTLTNLRRAWIEQDPEARVQWLERTVAAFISPEPIPSTLDLNRLRPAVRSRTGLGLTALERGIQNGGLAAGSNVPFAPIAADLAWTIVWDKPAVMRTIDEDQLIEWNRNFDELLAVAKMNLAMQPSFGWNLIEKRIFAPVGIDDYDGTRVFLPGALDFLPFDGERVVFHPTRANCAVVSAEDPVGIIIAARHTLTQVDSANRVSLMPVIGTTGNWRPLELSPEHPAYQDLRRLVIYERAAAYEAQSKLLAHVVGSDLFVAKFVVIEDQSGTLGSYCTWTRDVETLLPVADRVAFYEDGKDPFLVPWKTAVEVCGALMEPTRHSPDRVRVKTFPSDAELSVLRSASS